METRNLRIAYKTCRFLDILTYWDPKWLTKSSQMLIKPVVFLIFQCSRVPNFGLPAVQPPARPATRRDSDKSVVSFEGLGGTRPPKPNMKHLWNIILYYKPWNVRSPRAPREAPRHLQKLPAISQEPSNRPQGYYGFIDVYILLLFHGCL